ncbi:MAG: NAD(P)/FAD-dependent oxidoreductase [Actinomycetia bacterium]|nr:NAD(P)/FAD-dependent oxidoreductase [Actinomycetes bacterium]
MNEPDLVIVGGGPVGLVAALEARRAGLAVLVIEPRPAPIDKPCGQGIMPAGVGHLRSLGVEPPGAPFTAITYADAHHRATAHLRSGPGLGVRRTDLHAALSAAAAEAAVPVLQDAVTDVVPDDAGVAVRVRSGDEVRAAYVIGADGLHSRLRRVVGSRVVRPRRLRRFGFVTHASEALGVSEVRVHWTPLGEVYLTPLAGECTGVAVLTRSGTDPGAVVAAVPEVREMLGGQEVTFRGSGAFFQVPVRHVRGRVLLVGDAAGYVDALTGEGLTIGFAQARAAVEAVAGGDPARYERDWWRISTVPLGLAAGLVGATAMVPVRERIVAAAERLPGVFGSVVSVVGGRGLGDLNSVPIGRVSRGGG